MLMDVLDLLDWKRRIFELYAEIRSAFGPAGGVAFWREVRDDLFRLHPQSPLPEEARVGFDEVFRSEGISVIKAPVRAPQARAHAERWVSSLRRECLDRLLILGRRHLERVVHVDAQHYNEHRPHRSLAQRPPLAKPPPIDERAPIPEPQPLERLRRRDLLGGLLHEYELAA